MKFKVFGCKVNKYYTEKWLESEYLKDKNGIFIASCVVTDKAKRKWLKFVKDSVKELEIESEENLLSPTKNSSLANLIKEEGNMNPKIYISGCGVFKKGKVQTDFYKIYPELEEFKEKIILLGEEPETSPPTPLLKGEGRSNKKLSIISKKLPQIYTKKFLLIQGGCDSFCSFCLTVQKRGRHYYRDKNDIVNEIIEFEKSGGKEIVLTGVNLAAWGLGNTNDIKKTRFSELLDYILKNTKIPRIRISSLGPEFIDEKCLKLFTETRIYPHFHYSVQSGNSEILKSMKRHYNGKYIKKLLEKTKNLIRKDGVEVSIGADLIVGFPGETEENFLETYKLVKDGLITKSHIFPFSAHNFGEKVPASSFKNQIPEKVKKERVGRLEEISEQKREEFIKRNSSKKFNVLIEMVEKNKKQVKWKGWTENYIEVSEKNFEILEGKVKRNSLVKGVLR